MLVFRGLTLALLAGESIGPFPTQFQLLSSGFIPDFLGSTGSFHLTSLVIGVLVAATMFYSKSAHPAQSAEAWLPRRSLLVLYSGTRAYFEACFSI